MIKDLFVLFLVFTPKCEGKIRTKGGFCAPKRECVPKQKSCPPKKQQVRCHWGALSKKTFVLFLVFTLNLRAKFASKEVFMPPKQKSCPKRKQQDRRHRDAFVIKTCFLIFILEYIFCPTKIFYAPPSSPAHLSGAGSASMNRSEIRLKIVFLEDHNITSISIVCLGQGMVWNRMEDDFSIFHTGHFLPFHTKNLPFHTKIFFHIPFHISIPKKF